MKKTIVILLSALLALPVVAQKKSLELGIYGGFQSYTKTGNPYDNSFSSGFGIGFHTKYYLSNQVFWATELFGATDDGTEVRTQEGRILSLHRQDYSFSTGIGFDYLSTDRLKLYLQLNAGIGTIQGYNEYFKSEATGIDRVNIHHTAYIIAPTTGIDFYLNKQWKIGAGYTFRYLGDFDASHSIFARISFVLN